MKRSEMINLLVEKFRDSAYYALDEEIANIILITIEQAGMQPPNTTLEKLIPGALTDLKECRHYYACWEPEEEQYINFPNTPQWYEQAADIEEQSENISNKLMPASLTAEELADVEANDEDLSGPKHE